MAIKITLFMRLGRSGWQEVYYYDHGEGPTKLEVVGKPIGISLAKKRMGLCTNSVFCDAVRISDTEVKRAAILDESVQTLNGVTGTAGRRDVRGVAVLVSCQDTTRLYRRALWIRGVPDDWIKFSSDDRLALDPAWNGPFAEFAQFLGTEPKFGIRAIKRDSPANQPKEIRSIAVHATGNALLTVPGNALNQEKETVRIEKAEFALEFPTPLNGVWKAVGTPAAGVGADQVLLLNFPITTQQAAAYSGGGVLSCRRRQFIDISHVDPQRASIHATGRPTSEGRGRRRRRA